LEEFPIVFCTLSPWGSGEEGAAVEAGFAVGAHFEEEVVVFGLDAFEDEALRAPGVRGIGHDDLAVRFT
jgi:hypothetical protein